MDLPQCYCIYWCNRPLDHRWEDGLRCSRLHQVREVACSPLSYIDLILERPMHTRVPILLLVSLSA